MPDTFDRLKAALADRYTIEIELGRGGMATVYLAHDLKHDREVAVKVLKSDLSDELGADRFLREIKLAARLSHPHILPLLDSGEAKGFLFYVMPYVSLITEMSSRAIRSLSCSKPPRRGTFDANIAPLGISRCLIHPQSLNMSA